jgi:hypothetical protein
MRVRVRGLLPSTALLALLAGPFLPALEGAAISYSFSGSIESVTQAATTATGVIVGDTITGAFSYDPTQLGSGGNFTFTGSSKAHTMAFKIFNSAGAQVFTDSYSGNISAYYFIKVIYGFTANPLYPGINGTEMDIQGDTVYKQGLGVTHASSPGTPAFDLALFNPNNVGTSPTNPLPNATVIKNFVANKGLLTWDPPDQKFTAIVTFSIPEPSGLLLTSLGILTCAAGSSMAHKRARTSRRG